MHWPEPSTYATSVQNDTQFLSRYISEGFVSHGRLEKLNNHGRSMNSVSSQGFPYHSPYLYIRLKFNFGIVTVKIRFLKPGNRQYLLQVCKSESKNWQIKNIPPLRVTMLTGQLSVVFFHFSLFVERAPDQRKLYTVLSCCSRARELQLQLVDFSKCDDLRHYVLGITSLVKLCIKAKRSGTVWQLRQCHVVYRLFVCQGNADFSCRSDYISSETKRPIRRLEET